MITSTHSEHELAADEIEAAGIALRIGETGVIVLAALLLCPPLLILVVVVGIALGVLGVVALALAAVVGLPYLLVRAVVRHHDHHGTSAFAHAFGRLRRHA